MITEGAIINAVAIIVLIILPCIFKVSFNNIKGCLSFCLGFCCFFTTSVINSVIFFVFAYIMGKKGIFQENEFQENDYYNIDDIDDYLDLMLDKAKSLVYISLLLVLLIYIIIFLMLFLFIKSLSGQQSIYGAIFMFISGYFLLYIQYFGILLAISNGEDTFIDKLRDNNFNNVDFIEEILDKIILYSDLMLLIHILSIVGTSLMIFLHHKRANNSIIIICLVLFFLPIISPILGIFTRKFLIFWIITDIVNLLSFIIGFIFYCKYYKKDDEIDMKSMGFIEPQSPIQPPY